MDLISQRAVYDSNLCQIYRVGNLWLEQEELLRRSGVPDAPSRRHMCVIPHCTADGGETDFADTDRCVSISNSIL
jgi:hypothetical protein